MSILQRRVTWKNSHSRESNERTPALVRRVKETKGSHSHAREGTPWSTNKIIQKFERRITLAAVLAGLPLIIIVTRDTRRQVVIWHLEIVATRTYLETTTYNTCDHTSFVNCVWFFSFFFFLFASSYLFGSDVATRDVKWKVRCLNRLVIIIIDVINSLLLSFFRRARNGATLSLICTNVIHSTGWKLFWYVRGARTDM